MSHRLDRYVNINSIVGAGVISRTTGECISHAELSAIWPPSLAALELSESETVEIPKPVRQLYRAFRPTPLRRASRLERHLGTNCKIYYKDEGATPTGTHKPNSAYLIAYLCACDGVRVMVTETTGNWGPALALAAQHFRVGCVCFVDEVSIHTRPGTVDLLRGYGAEVVVVQQNRLTADYLTMSANAAITYTKAIKGAAYIFGSIFGYFIIPQSIIGLEAQSQLASIEAQPDVVIASCGGGANFLGLAAPFLIARLRGARKPEFLAAEADTARVVSRSRPGVHCVDELDYYPPLRSRALPDMDGGSYIGGLGSRVVAPAIGEFLSRRLITPITVTSHAAMQAAHLFFEIEGRWVALESSYTLAATIAEVTKRQHQLFLINLSCGDTDKHIFSEQVA